MHDAEDARDGYSTDDASADEALDDGFAYILGSRLSVNASSHPPAELIHQLWQTFLTNVDPLSKLVHVPSLQPAIEKAIMNIERVPKGFEALMFAIYSTAVLSLTDDECKETLGEARSILLAHYVAATKTALSRARFMSSTSIVVLQALMLHILSIRDAQEPRAVWALTGATIRIAENMGMRLDGTFLGLSPFETEIRRRVWWQLRMHDFRAAELSGQAKFREFGLDETSPRKPSNLNDRDIYPGMLHAVPESTRPTEMIWCVFRSELATFAASQKVKMVQSSKSVVTSEEYPAMDDLTVKDNFIKQMEDMIETKFLRFCDPSQPLEFLTLIAARMSTNLVRFLAHHPRRWANLDQVSDSEKQMVWGITLQLMEQYNMLQSSPQLRRFAWNTPYFIQWHAVIHILDTLRAHPLHQDATKAWRLIDSLYEHNDDLLLSTKKPILMAVGNLCLKAYKARVTALRQEGRSHPAPPDYITKLQEQREAAKARREAAAARSKAQATIESEMRLMTTDTNETQSYPTPESAHSGNENQPQHYSAPIQSTIPSQGGTWNGDDAFWLNDAQDNGFSTAGGVADLMNLDTDAILSQDSWLDTSNGDAIDWAQWDTWLGNLNPQRPDHGAGTGQGPT